MDKNDISDFTDINPATGQVDYTNPYYFAIGAGAGLATEDVKWSVTHRGRV
jgi:hypothetical protein